MNFNSEIVIKDGLEKFWQSICCQLKSLNKNQFSFKDYKKISLHIFTRLFLKSNHSNAKESILIVDEASYIGGNNDKTIIKDFIDSLQFLKDEYDNQFNLYSILFVGTELIKEFLINHKNSGTISPFSAEVSLMPTKFNQAEIKELLCQYSNDRNFELEEYGISENLFTYS